MFDPDAPQFQAEDGKPLFQEKDGEWVPSPVLEDVRRFLGNLEREFQRTRALFAPLREKDVLVPAQLKLTVNGKQHAVRGFSMVDWNKVKELDDATLAGWARSGLIALIHAHLMSIEDLLKSSKRRPKESTVH